METLRRLACDYVTDRIGPERLPMVAVEALERGLDSPSLRELAGLHPTTDVRDIRDVYLRAMDELGIEIPDADSTRWDNIHFWARQVLDGVVSPQEGASRITEESYRLGEPENLREIYVLTILWDDDPVRRPALEQSMRTAIRGLLQEGLA